MHQGKLQALAGMHCHHADRVDVAGRRRQPSQLLLLVEDLEAPDVFEKGALGIYSRIGTERKSELQQLVNREAALLPRNAVIGEEDLQMVSAPEKMLQEKAVRRHEKIDRGKVVDKPS
jgi:hypothetical protein